ncbi:MAG: hypothetical protein FJ399_08760 [Verrucomicrobia bacterium]|nr:hypothetical protein [Verrucomicrobiota bacterium]
METWLRGQVGHAHYDHIAWQYAALAADQDAAGAATWAATIRNPGIRRRALESIRLRAAPGKP